MSDGRAGGSIKGPTSDDQLEQEQTTKVSSGRLQEHSTYINDRDGLETVSKMNQWKGNKAAYIFKIDKGISNAASSATEYR